MKALVTGSAGFLGRHFVAALRAAGHAVYGWDVAEEHPVDALEGFRDGGDRFRPDLVIHCAAVAPHRAAIDGRALTVGAGNLALDAAMFEWAARMKPGRVVYISSSAVYPVNRQNSSFWGVLREIDMDDLEVGAQAPDAIYGWVKLMGEYLAQAYRGQGGAVTVVRPFSGYGEDQSPEFPFGAFRDRARRREDPFVVWGDGTQVRDWIHVDDVVGATLAAVERGIDGPVNLCTGIGTSMRELATLFMVAAGYCPEFGFQPDRPAGVAYRVGGPGRMCEFYQPKVTLEQGVRRALAEVSHGAR